MNAPISNILSEKMAASVGILNSVSIRFLALGTAVLLLANCSSGPAASASQSGSTIEASTSSSSEDMSAMAGVRRLNASTYGYNGWIMNIDGVSDRSNLLPVVRSIARQIDMVENSWANENVKQFMRSQVIWVTTDLGDEGKYGGDGSMYMNAIVHDPGHVVLLHELLHAYHDQILGFDDPTVAQYYQTSVKRNLWPNVYVSKNKLEFFAVTSSLALSEIDMPRPPYSAAELATKMPAYYNWLVQTFM